MRRLGANWLSPGMVKNDFLQTPGRAAIALRLRGWAGLATTALRTRGGFAILSPSNLATLTGLAVLARRTGERAAPGIRLCNKRPWVCCARPMLRMFLSQRL